MVPGRASVVKTGTHTNFEGVCPLAFPPLREAGWIILKMTWRVKLFRRGCSADGGLDFSVGI